MSGIFCSIHVKRGVAVFHFFKISAKNRNREWENNFMLTPAGGRRWIIPSHTTQNS
jgi:hypothetical protein